MQELASAVIDVTDILESIVANSLECRNPSSHGEVLMERFRPPVGRFLGGNDRSQAVALIAIWNLDVSPVKKRCGQVQIQSDRVAHFAFLIGRNARVGHDQRHTQRLFEVRPLPGEASVAHVVTVVRRVHDDCVFSQAGFFQSGHEATDRSVNSADHTIVGSDVRLIFLVRVPSPEESFAVDGRL